MRQLALCGLVVSLLLGGIAVFETNESVSTRRNEQDRSLQSAVASELSLISGGERQTTTALSLMLVNPAVRQLLTTRGLAARARSQDIAATRLALATIQRSSFVRLTAACLDDGSGRQIVCGPTTRAPVFPLSLSRQFLSLAGSALVSACTGTVCATPVTVSVP